MTWNMAWRKVVPAVAVGLVLVLAGFGGVPVAKAQGKIAPDFELKDLDGKDVRLSGFRGQRPVLLYFWATWCPYCMEVKPLVAQIRNSVAASDLEVLAVNVGGRDTVERLKQFQVAHPAPYPTLYDGGGMVSSAYGVRGIPFFVVVSKTGEVVYRNGAPPMDINKYLQ